MNFEDIKFRFVNISKWATLCSLIIIFYIIAIYAICLSLRFFYYFVNGIAFIRWAKNQKLILISGGPGSGKKVLLTFLNENLKNTNVNTYNHLCFFNSNKSYDIEKKEWRSFYTIEDFNKKKKSYFFINEIEDNSFNLNSKKSLSEKESVVSNISISNYFNNRFWIAFSSKDGFLWNKLSSRAGSTIECNGVEKISLKYFKFYFLKILIKENQKEFRKLTIIITEGIFLKYRNTWLKEFLSKNSSFKN